MRSVKKLGIALLAIYLFILTTAPLLYAILQKKEATTDSNISQDLFANWLSYLNFLLTFIALLATVAGIVFTYNQFVQAKQLAKKIDDTMKEKFNEWEERTDKKLKNMIKAYSSLNKRLPKMLEKFVNPVYHHFWKQKRPIPIYGD
ncbi:hypothetical protein [Laceyella tengchongensis]|uniref:hypothetical protein n=1 Tax=Laceyella tengchongensis TaxID=574699 RepID=UPI0012B89C25|nr:hypothetical protein [Laceyella tengchongensis]